MDKNTFLQTLQKRLKGLPEEDVLRTLDYYREMIEDRMEEGLTEEEAVADMGAVDEIAEPLLPKSTKRKRSAWEIVLLVLGFPVWFSLLAAVAAVIIAIVVSVYAVDICLAACCLGGVLGAVVYLVQLHWTGAVFLFGAGLVCGGLAILCFMGSNRLMKLGWHALRKTIRKGR